MKAPGNPRPLLPKRKSKMFLIFTGTQEAKMPGLSVRWRSALLVVLVFCAPLSARAATSQHLLSHRCSYQYRVDDVRIDGRPVPIELYVPKGAGPFPLVFMLHGSAGAFSIHPAGAPATDNFGEHFLARQCLLVALPHYIQAFGYSSFWSQQQILALFPHIFDVVSRLLDTAETLPQVRGQPVFLFGQSLDGYLGLALALRRAEVRAVSDFSGGFPRGYSLDRSGPLNILVSHGEVDSVIPVSQAYMLQRYCRHHGIAVQLKVYPDQGHYFTSAATSEVIENTASLFVTLSRARTGISRGQRSDEGESSDLTPTDAHFSKVALIKR